MILNTPFKQMIFSPKEPYFIFRFPLKEGYVEFFIHDFSFSNDLSFNLHLTIWKDTFWKSEDKEKILSGITNEGRFNLKDETKIRKFLLKYFTSPNNYLKEILETINKNLEEIKNSIRRKR